MWDWLEAYSYSRRFITRLLLKAALLFLLCNVSFIWVPMSTLEGISLYNTILPGRQRFPFANNPQIAYNISVNSLEAMFQSHVVSSEPESDEYRVFILGDSATWGYLLEANETYSAYVNDQEATLADGRKIIAYNLAYPTTAAMKDVLITDYANRYEPDLTVWLVTLDTFARGVQMTSPLVENNFTYTEELIVSNGGNLTGYSEAPSSRLDLVGSTLVGRRGELGNLLRLQLYGVAWAATQSDQYIPDSFDLRESDFEEDYSWDVYENETDLSADEIALNILSLGVNVTESPIIIINEPIFISDGENSDVRYNSMYPRWAYDQYRDLLAEAAAENGWLYYDWWDAIAPEEFTDSPLHLSPQGSQQLAEGILEAVLYEATSED